MKKFGKLFLWAGVLFCVVYGQGETNPQVEFKTDLGNFTIEVYVTKAPITANNFLRYVDAGLFDGATFYRVVTMDNQPNDDIKIEVIQGGLSFTKESQGYEPIAHETTAQTGVLHKDGVISMARFRPGSASSEFFICIGDQPELDFGGKRNPDEKGFAAFGQVIKGMEVVRKIHQQPVKAQMLVTRVKITSVRRLPHT